MQKSLFIRWYEDRIKMIIKPFINNKNEIDKKKIIVVCHLCKLNERMFYKSELDETLQKLKNKKYHDGQYRCWPCSQKNRKKWGVQIGHEYKYKSNQRYVRIKTENGREHEHRLIIEKHLNRDLTSQEHVHHIDFDSLNNNLTNLYVCQNGSEHRKIAIELERLGYEFLNKRIWFDKKNKLYTLEKIENQIFEEPLIILPAYSSKIYTGRHDRLGRHYPTVQTARHVHKTYWKLVMECFLQRELVKGECIHHIDNNSINNLCLLTNKEHQKAHNSLLKCCVELYKNGLIKFHNGTYFET